MTTYVFSPDWTTERDRLLALEALFDGESARHLAGVGVSEGWRCLEVGCGAGGIARWLAECVSPTGRVVATDLDTRFVEGHGRDNLEVRRHDIQTDPLDEGEFDLVHARAVIEHLPDHRAALRRLVAALRPGGWAVIEDTHFGGPMSAALGCYAHPADQGPLVGRLYSAVDTLFAAAGADGSFGPTLPSELKAVGLERVGGVVHTPVVAGGTENWVRGTLEQLAPRLVAAGLATSDEVARWLAIAAEGSTHYAPPLMVTAWGRRPVEATPRGQ
ncbi:MAG TPA: methyltransferase domain-containing protein [Candidatus Dormibacteraeota bacterium]|nr:methyltransferase domain-containing protein [Candidatus Dormibacteraeota bacterium]